MKNNKTIIWIAAILVLGGGGYAFYRWWKNRKPEEQAATSTDSTAGTTTGETSTGGMSTGGMSTGGTSTGGTDISKYLDTPEKINTFRKWFNSSYPAAAKNIKLDPTGKLNSTVEKAWNTMDSKGFKVGDYYVKITTDWKPKYKVGDSVKLNNKTYKVTKVYPSLTKDANIVAPAYELVSGSEKIYKFL